MKILKISLAIVVVGIITFFVIKSIGGSPPPPPPPPPTSKPFTRIIEDEINNLSTLPDNKFYKNEYNEIKYHIDEYYKNQQLGETKFENDEGKVTLSKKLDFAYADKFIKQAFYVFNNSEWQINNLAFIRSECQLLRNTKFLENGSPVDKSFSKIQQILSKYDEINSFIATSKYFSFSDTSLRSKFPFSDLKVKIARIDTYKRNNLENNYVNNCSRLHNELTANKKRLIDSYLTYLDTKINKWTGKSKQFKFASFNEYQSIIYNPLKKELEDFKINCNSNNYDNIQYINISNRLNADRREVYLSFS